MVKVKIYKLVLSLVAFSLSPAICNAATLQEFSGTWAGFYNFHALDGETNSGSIKWILKVNGQLLIGTFSADNEQPVALTASVISGKLVFKLPVLPSDAGDPDCAGQDVTFTSIMEPGKRKLSFNAPGIYCGDGGGKPATSTGTLTKRDGANIVPVSTLLLL